MARQLRIWAAVTAALTLLGLPAGLLWSWLSDRAEYLVFEHRTLLVDPDTQALIGADGRLALICGVLGAVAGAVAYGYAGRRNEVALALGLAAGGLLGSLVAWQTGHLPGLAGFEHAVATAADGTRVRGILDLGARGVLTVWPLVAVTVFGVLEAIDLARRSYPAYGREPGPGQPHQVGGGQLDLQAAPSSGDVDRREP